MKSIRHFHPVSGGVDRRRRAVRAAGFAAVFAAAVMTGIATGAGGARAAELVLFESETCEWCERFDKEIAPAYPHTAESACAPLRRVDVHDPRPADLEHIKGVVYTPTFVLVEDGREVGRLTGYPGEDFFWSLLDRDLKKLQRPCDLR